MKKLATLLALIMLSGCTEGNMQSISEPTDDYEDGYVRESVRLINVDGDLYFDSGLFSDLSPRCGTADGMLKKTAEKYEVPKSGGECNFDAPYGYQNATSITKELSLDGGWAIFKKIKDYGDDLTRYRYVYKLTGTHPNAARESEYIILANTMDITFDTVTKYFFSSQLVDHWVDMCVVFPDIGDEWGILMYADNVSENSLRLNVEQFGGNADGELLTGRWFEIEKHNGEKWEKVDFITDGEVVWRSDAMKINENDMNCFDISWEYIYGTLEPGRYRISKKIMNLRTPGDFDEKIYSTEFEIEKGDVLNEKY